MGRKKVIKGGVLLVRQEYFRDTQLIDFDGEVWIDIFGFDGMYSVSNYGRIKSEDRYDNRGRKVKGRILKQTVGCNGEPTVKLSREGIHYTKRPIELVGIAFKGWKKEGEEYCHRNKVKTDNRKDNIIVVSHSDSLKQNYKMGVQQDWGIGTERKIRADERLEIFGVYEDGILSMMICSKCNRELPLSAFYFRHDSNTYRHECKECSLKRLGINEIGKLTERLELAKHGYRYCSTCKQLKSLDSDFGNSKHNFMGKSNSCKECVKASNLKWRMKYKQISH